MGNKSSEHNTQGGHKRDLKKAFTFMNINLETRYTILESDRQQFHYEPRNESGVCACVSLNALRMDARMNEAASMNE